MTLSDQPRGDMLIQEGEKERTPRQLNQVIIDALKPISSCVASR